MKQKIKKLEDKIEKVAMPYGFFLNFADTLLLVSIAGFSKD